MNNPWITTEPPQPSHPNYEPPVPMFSYGAVLTLFGGCVLLVCVVGALLTALLHVVMAELS